MSGRKSDPMGREALCIAHYRRRASKGRALLETDALIFRGEFRLNIPLASVKTAKARNGRLTVTFPEGSAMFELGPRAERWAEGMRVLKRLVDKLGIKSGSRVVVLGIRDSVFWAQLNDRAVKASKGKLIDSADIIVVAVNALRDLARLRPLQNSLARNGAIWVVAPRGSKHIPEREILAAGLAAGLVDVKVARFSETHTAHKFVIPLKRR